MVAIAIEIGTPATTISPLDVVVPVRVRWPVETARLRARLVQRGGEHAGEGQQRDHHQRHEERVAGPDVAARDDHASVPFRVSHWTGRMQTRTCRIRTTASAEATPTSRLKKASW